MSELSQSNQRSSAKYGSAKRQTSQKILSNITNALTSSLLMPTGNHKLTYVCDCSQRNQVNMCQWRMLTEWQKLWNPMRIQQCHKKIHYCQLYGSTMWTWNVFFLSLFVTIHSQLIVPGLVLFLAFVWKYLWHIDGCCRKIVMLKYFDFLINIFRALTLLLSLAQRPPGSLLQQEN